MPKHRYKMLTYDQMNLTPYVSHSVVVPTCLYHMVLFNKRKVAQPFFL